MHKQLFGANVRALVKKIARVYAKAQSLTNYCALISSSFYQIAKRVICRRNNSSGNSAPNGFAAAPFSSPRRDPPPPQLRRNNSFQLDDTRFMTRTRLRPGGPGGGHHQKLAGISSGRAAASTLRQQAARPTYRSADPQAVYGTPVLAPGGSRRVFNGPPLADDFRRCDDEFFPAAFATPLPARQRAEAASPAEGGAPRVHRIGTMIRYSDASPSVEEASV